MPDTISQALGTKWSMFYHPAWPIQQLRPVQTLAGSIAVVNQQLAHTRELAKWHPSFQDEAARLLWVNWIYQRLSHEPIRKPILAHWDEHGLKVDCGDTRLMALELFNPNSTVAVVITCKRTHEHRFELWQRIGAEQDLRQASGFDDQAHVLIRADSEHCLSWLEIGDDTTAHHLHSVDQRLTMLQNYVDLQPATFEFSRAWAQSSISWEDYQATE